MGMRSRQAVSVTTAATRLDVDPVATDPVAGDRVLIVAQAAGTLVLGGPDVTAITGCRVPVVAGTVISVDLDRGEAVYGIVASGTLAVDVLIGGA